MFWSLWSCTPSRWEIVHVATLELIRNSAVLPTETNDEMRAFAEQVFASETKDESVRDEFSMFGVAEDCPILQNEIAHHVHTEDNVEKR